jgi:hypothetical protein
MTTTTDAVVVAEETNKDNESTHKAAFMILVDKEGNYVFEPDINKAIIPERKPTGAEVKSALSSILDEVKAQEIAMTTLTLMQMQARAAQEAAQNQALLQQMRMPR